MNEYTITVEYDSETLVIKAESESEALSKADIRADPCPDYSLSIEDVVELLDEDEPDIPLSGQIDISGGESE